MHISEILSRKGKTDLVSIAPQDSIERAAQILAAKGIGALLVMAPPGRLAGILSERDIVHAIAHHGPRALRFKVDDIMTREVLTCRPADTVRDVMMLITARRIRHVPVTDGERIVDIVSIGDLLKWRIQEQDLEVATLRDITMARI